MPGQETSPSELTFNYRYSELNRVIRVDGIWGGVAPGGDINMAVFSQIFTMPESVTYELDPQGMLGQEKARTQADGFTRTIEAELMFNVGAAVVMRNWLDDRIKQIEERQRGTPSD